jgi:hypothetical protein
MLTQSITLHRCASCKRWSGSRQVGVAAQTVEIDSEQSTGLCIDGPWDGNERRARSACGHWIVWSALTQKNASD